MTHKLKRKVSEHYSLVCGCVRRTLSKCVRCACGCGRKSAHTKGLEIRKSNIELSDISIFFLIASPSPALASGAITVSDPLMDAVNSPSRPKIPDRKTKPTASLDLPSVPPPVDRSSIASDMNSRASVGSEFNKAMVSIDDTSSASDDSSYIVKFFKALCTVLDRFHIRGRS